MPPRKKKRAAGNTAVQGAATQSSSPLESLPLTALALIYQHSDASTRSALLRTSKWGRDLVLREAKTIRLTLGNSDTPGGRKPIVRHLNRACNAGEDGRMTLCMDARQVHAQTARNNLLKDLLALGIQQHGWTSVASLMLCVSAVVLLLQLCSMM
jgi:hypothetical protein